MIAIYNFTYYVNEFEKMEFASIHIASNKLGIHLI